MTWLFFALATACFLAGADVCVKLAAGKVSSSLGLLIYGSCTFLAGVGWVLWQRLHGAGLIANPRGVVAAVGVGLCFSGVTTGLYLTFSAGAPLSLASPLIRLSGLLLAGLAGLTFFGEPLTWRYGGGLALSCFGLYLMVTR